jgi:hypothetical protein
MNNYLIIAVIVITIIIFASSSSRTSSPSITHLGDFTLGPATSVVFPLPITGRSNFGPDSTLTLSCTVISDDFFSKSNGTIAEGHCGIMLRADLAAIATTLYRGHGVIMGSLWTGSPPPNGMHAMTSCAAIETWAKGAAYEPSQWVKPQSISPILSDGVPYLLEIVSRFQGNTRLISFRLGDFQSPVIEDDNQNINPASQAIALFAYNPGGGVMHFNGVTAVWS